MRKILILLCLLLVFSAGCGASAESAPELSGLQEAELWGQIIDPIVEKQPDRLDALFYDPEDSDIAALHRAVESSEIDILANSLLGNEKVEITKQITAYPAELRYRFPEQSTVFIDKTTLYVYYSAEQPDPQGQFTEARPRIFLSWAHIPAELRGDSGRPDQDSGVSLINILEGEAHNT